MKRSLFNYAYPEFAEDDAKVVIDVLSSGNLTDGLAARKLEKLMCTVTGCKTALAVNSCTAALKVAAYIVSTRGNGDSVIVPSITFASTANAFRQAGFHVYFADVDPVSLQVSIASVANVIALSHSEKRRVAAIIGVDFGADLCDLSGLSELASEIGASLILDAAHSVGAKNWIARLQECVLKPYICLSFHALKNVTGGEGGCIVSSMDDLSDTDVSAFRQHGLNRNPDKPWELLMNTEGENLRITAVSAALVCAQMDRIGRIRAHRRSLHEKYSELFNSSRLAIQPMDAKYGGCPHLIIATMNGKKGKRDRLLKHFRDTGIGAAFHYPPVYSTPFWQRQGNYKYCEGYVASRIGSQILTLPCWTGVSTNDVESVYRAYEQF